MCKAVWCVHGCMCVLVPIWTIALQHYSRITCTSFLKLWYHVMLMRLSVGFALHIHIRLCGLLLQPFNTLAAGSSDLTLRAEPTMWTTMIALRLGTDLSLFLLGKRVSEWVWRLRCFVLVYVDGGAVAMGNAKSHSKHHWWKQIVLCHELLFVIVIGIKCLPWALHMES